jgi:hypothetical protein
MRSLPARHAIPDVDAAVLRRRGPRSKVAAMRFLLVRHAMPNVDPAVPPRQRRLGVAGLGAVPSPPACRVASKAIDPGFAAARRDQACRDDHVRLARAYVPGAAHPGRESRSDAVARHCRADADRHLVGRTHGMALTGRLAADALAPHCRAVGDRPLVGGTHGMALARRLAVHGVIAGPVGDVRAALRFPDTVTFDIDPDHPVGLPSGPESVCRHRSGAVVTYPGPRP